MFQIFGGEIIVVGQRSTKSSWHLFTLFGRAFLYPNVRTFVEGPFSSLLSVFSSLVSAAQALN